MEIRIYRSGSIPEYVFKDVSDLLHDAFEERRLQGLDFKCGTFSPLQMREYLQSGEAGYLINALENERLVGTLTLIIRKKSNYIYGSHDNLAILSSEKGKGVAAFLFQNAVKLSNDLNLDFLTSTTAVNAYSSVKFHQKVGFVIYSKSYGSSYNSYNYIYPLNKLRFLKIALIRRFIYLFTTLLGIYKILK